MARVRGRGTTNVTRTRAPALPEPEIEPQVEPQVQEDEGDDNSSSEESSGTSSDSNSDSKGEEEGGEEDIGKEGEEGEEGEEEHDEEGEKFNGDDMDEELKKLTDPPPVLTKADFLEKYGFKDEGYLPNRLTRWKGKKFDDRKCVKFFGKPVGPKGRYGYNWSDVKPPRLQKRIKELLRALYQRTVPRTLLPHKMARGIALEEENIPINWAAYGEATNKFQRLCYERNVMKLQKMKGKAKVTGTVGAWRKLQVDKRELQSEICEGKGSSMGGIVLEEEECNSRLEYLGRLLAVEKLELEARVEAEQEASSAKERRTEALNHHKGVLKIMKGKQATYKKNLQEASKDGVVDSKTAEIVDAYDDLVRGEVSKVNKLKDEVATLGETLKLEQDRVLKMRIQVRGLQEEHAYLGRSSCGFHLRPLPMVYAGAVCGGGGGDYICAFCGFTFPHFEVIVSACKHLYHPWCALLNFTEGTKCSALNCQEVQPIEWIMSFGWRGVRGCGRPGGGGEEWMKLKAECATAITGGLAARSDAATEFRAAIQQSRSTVEDEELNSSDGEGVRGYSTAPWELPSVFWGDRGRGSPAFRLQERAQVALSKTTTGAEALPSTVDPSGDVGPIGDGEDDSLVRGCDNSFCMGCEECTTAMQNSVHMSGSGESSRKRRRSRSPDAA